MDEEPASTWIEQGMKIAAQDIWIGYAHYHMGESDEAIWRIDTAMGMLRNAKARILEEKK